MLQLRTIYPYGSNNYLEDEYKKENTHALDDSHKTNPQIIGRNNYYEKTNDNGKRLVSLCQQTNLRQVPSRFPLLSRTQWTWKHPRGSKTVVPHIGECKAGQTNHKLQSI